MHVQFLNFSCHDVTLEAGEPIAQFILLPHTHFVQSIIPGMCKITFKNFFTSDVRTVLVHEKNRRPFIFPKFFTAQSESLTLLVVPPFLPLLMLLPFPMDPVKQFHFQFVA